MNDQRLSKLEKKDYPQQTSYNYTNENNSKSNSWPLHSNDSIPTNYLKDNLDISLISSSADKDVLRTNKLTDLSLPNTPSKSNPAEQIDAVHMSNLLNNVNSDYEHINTFGPEFVTAAIFYSFEKDQWTYYDAVWFCFISFTTIGYGDKTPRIDL
ncbi:hypothetical protein AYI70_g9885 [Smittium culicis]|uniref:Potassium channel domain-containing protein n=1 Tax=Smittium culicis TaxID=133412 RepID=A0A1R1X982_9FUNG|nr:hypothetical protein AYI70_g9885 [Smittium culicis]